MIRVGIVAAVLCAPLVTACATNDSTATGAARLGCLDVSQAFEDTQTVIDDARNHDATLRDMASKMADAMSHLQTAAEIGSGVVKSESHEGTIHAGQVRLQLLAGVISRGQMSKLEANLNALSHICGGG